MRTLAALMIVTALPGPGPAQTPQERARIALSMASSSSQVQAVQGTVASSVCACGANCTCTTGQCGDLNCPTLKTKASGVTYVCYCDDPANCPCSDPNCVCYPATAKLAPGPWEWALYEVAYNRSVRTNTSLLIWVGETCPACEQLWTSYVHARLSEYPSQSGTVKGPCCILCKPDGLGGLDKIATLNGIPTKGEVDAFLAPLPPLPLRNVQPSYQPMQRPMMMPMMMGGFGGGGGCSS